jgi:hypothetical protein
MFLSNNFCDNMVAMAGWHPPCNNALKVLSTEMDLAESISSFDRSSLMSEVLRFSEKSVSPLSCESPLKFRASQIFLIGNLETYWISLRRGDRKTVVHSNWSYLHCCALANVGRTLFAELPKAHSIAFPIDN